MSITDHDTIPEIALAWEQAGARVALATVVQTWGSAPRQPGAQLAIREDGTMMGSVSGGCVEGAVVFEAMEALESGKPRLLTYGVADETAFEVGLACGGTIRILVDPIGPQAPALHPDMLAELVAARAARHPIALLTDLDSFARRLAGTDAPDLADRFRADRSGPDEAGQMVTLYNPPLRLVIVGAVHIAQALVPMARLAGYDAVVVDPRDAFASETRFPDTRLLHDWPDDALLALGLDARTAVVTLTHDSKLDDPAIIAALRSDVFYLGCLGSTRTHAKRLERLHAEGLTETDVSRIHAPVGLNIGARSPSEIAVATLAQITLALRGAK
ncbi:putative xanthine dehydrogenase subunit A [Roseibaca ekhonensis]|jgi:xanthine dehydrogenase accessory factor|uniref:Putative xanthine dehydrogenase subunit A n=1 Tax=Roseinatronobacter ekhonensis TaxID=254356 RepID=A0A3B0ML90_9RHOB|nr:putative xanthine dehydrogenase subunit A [Roseibaca ekhonensis]